MQCVGCEPGVDPARFPNGTPPAAPWLHEARGKCSGPFPERSPLAAGFKARGALKVEGGRVLIRGDVIYDDPRFGRYWFDRCPLARIGARNCPRPDLGEGWLGSVFDAAALLENGVGYSEYVERPSDWLKQGALVAMSERNAVAARKADDARAMAKVRGR